ncbi:hypothetical protein ABZ770_38320 [Streptomyces sp. NPDC006654]|uniref:hypothetical protein n=1 Tax=unclassified Streptomyces TaxID=2593676 RepID=UPI0033DF9810
MTRTRTRRLAMFTATTALAAGGVLLPTSAFAAPAHSGGGGHYGYSHSGGHSHYGDSGHYGHYGDSGRQEGGRGSGQGGGSVIIINNNIPIFNNIGVAPAGNTPANGTQ